MTAGFPAVVVFGSLHYDIMVEAPDRPRKGETLVGQGWRPALGGKGRNQAAAAARAGAGTAMIGAVGRDAFGLALLASLDEAGVDRRNVVERAEVGSGMSVAITDPEGDYGAVIVSAANLTLDSTFVAQHGGCIDTARVLVLQNETPEAANVAAAARARRADVLVVLNAAPAREPHPDLPALIDILVVNAIEAEMLGGGVVETLEDAVRAASLLLERFRAVVVTAGGAGLAYVERDTEPVAMAAVPVRVRSTHGAGDVFVGTLAARLSEASDRAQALATANAAAAAWVSRDLGSGS